MGLCYRLQLPKFNSAARWLEQTASAHTVLLNGGHVLLTQAHMTNFKILRSSRHIDVGKVYKI